MEKTIQHRKILTTNHSHYYTPKKSDNSLSSNGRSLVKLQFKQKVQSIRQKCLNKSPLKLKIEPREKTYSTPNEQLDISLQSQQQTDDADIEENVQSFTILKKSKYPGRPSTVHFSYPSYCQIVNKFNKDQFQKIPLLDLKYKIYGSEYRCIVNAFEFNGFRRGKEWDVFFDVRGSQIKRTCSSISPKKRFNHFAGCWYLGRKDKLWRGIDKLRKVFPLEYNFVPKTYILPNDYERFQAARQSAPKEKLWIQKPVASACGRCIKLVNHNTLVKKRKNILISEYIENPHLINGLKYDLRLYVLVTSFDPLKIYLFEDGLVRFATEEYSKTKKDLSKKFVHLTNFSINKHSKRFIPNNNVESQKVSKWSVKMLKNYYKKHGINHEKIFADIEDVIIKTCISAESNVLAPKYRGENKKSSFQLFGFDVLIDSQFKPWLLQVNVCPSLCSSSPLDKKIKHTLLVDVLNLVGIEHTQQNKIEKQKIDGGIDVKEQKKRIKFKNFHKISSLTFDNCVEILQPEDWLIILQSEEEIDRIGHFQRIFPLQKNIQKFEKHFQYTRYNNFLLWHHILSPKNFLNRIGL